MYAQFFDSSIHGRTGEMLYTNKGKGIGQYSGKCWGLYCGWDHGPPLKAICKIPSWQGHLEDFYLPPPETIIYPEDISPFFISII